MVGPAYYLRLICGGCGACGTFFTKIYLIKIYIRKRAFLYREYKEITNRSRRSLRYRRRAF